MLKPPVDVLAIDCMPAGLGGPLGFPEIEGTSAVLHQLAESLGSAIDAKDQRTRFHSDEVAVVARLLAQEMRLADRIAETVHVAGHLHDIGKIGVPDAVLAKDGPLTDTEWSLIRRHPVIGARILEPVTFFAGSEGIARMVLCHHERWDGGGYPLGLAGTDIPQGARIIAVADSFSAMLQDRPYRRGLGFDEACRRIAEASGTQLDPGVTAAFAHVADQAFALIHGLRSAVAA